MEHRKLGNSTLSVSAIGLGCMSMSGVYGPANDAESINLVRYAVDRGINFLDTSDAYGHGHNEELLSKALKGGYRQKVVLATKFGNTKEGPVRGAPDYVIQACDASLMRLGTDVIDLFYQHRVDPRTPIEETVGAMSRLVEQGKVRYLGLSEAAPGTIERAHKIHPITAVQSEYSLQYREIAEETLPVTRKRGISYVAYSPLGRSMLTGTIHKAEDIPAEDRRRMHPRFAGVNLDKNLSMIQRVEEIARELRVKPSQLVLAWLLTQGQDIVPIPGTKRQKYFDENLGALNIKLSDQTIRELSEAMPVGSAAGTRYPEAQLKNVQL
jgi:aryl-alcohol dehydrogenase-like predicted oxidoreductase